jgi:nucleotide sugar dehydrogenase
MKNIGIIGKGFVGSAVANGFSPNTGFDAKIRVYDKDPSRCINSLEETVNESDFIFLSLPTPSNKDGSISLKLLEDSLKSINDINKSSTNILLLRSTVVPGTSRMFQDKYKNLRIVFNPEFLTERSAFFDFINQSRIILGGEPEYTKKVSMLYEERFGSHLPILQTNYESAELIKYMNNCFFATKVSFLNEMKLISDNVGANWDDAVEGFILDGRIGHSHINVPGHDGKLGFGGSCFPKDVQALVSFGKSLGLDLCTLEGAWHTNLKVRPEKDWEELKGRAVTDEKE